MYHVSEIQRLPFRERCIGSAVVVYRAPGDRFTTILFVLSWAEIAVSAVIASPRHSAIAPRNTQMNANGKELLLCFAKLSECDTSSCRFGSNAALDEKRCEDAPHSKSTSCKTFFRFVSIRGQPIFAARERFEL